MTLAREGTIFFLLLMCSIGVAHAWNCVNQEGNYTVLYATSNSITVRWMMSRTFMESNKPNYFIVRHRLRPPYSVYVRAKLEMVPSLGYYVYRAARYVKSERAEDKLPWVATKVPIETRGNPSTAQPFVQLTIPNLPFPNREYEIQIERVPSDGSFPRVSAAEAEPFQFTNFTPKEPVERTVDCDVVPFYGERYRLTARTLEVALHSGEGLFVVDRTGQDLDSLWRQQVTLYWTPEPGYCNIRAYQLGAYGNRTFVLDHSHVNALDGSYTTRVSWEPHEFYLSQETFNGPASIVKIPGAQPFVPGARALCAWQESRMTYKLTWKRPREDGFRISSYTIAVLEVTITPPEDIEIQKMLASVTVNRAASVLEIKGVSGLELWKTHLFALSVNAVDGNSSGIIHFFKQIPYGPTFEERIEEWSVE